MSLNISTVRAIICPGLVADGIGSICLQACADAAGAVISIPMGSRTHTGKAYWPAADREDGAKMLAYFLGTKAPDRTPGVRAFLRDCLALEGVPPADELRAAAGEMLERMEEAMEVHIYSADDGEKPEADCQYVASIERVRKALGLVPSGIETLPSDAAWDYSATFADEDGDSSSFSARVQAISATDALIAGRAELQAAYPTASKVDARVDAVAN